jgi:hypothetical protein
VRIIRNGARETALFAQREGSKRRGSTQCRSCGEPECRVPVRPRVQGRAVDRERCRHLTQDHVGDWSHQATGYAITIAGTPGQVAGRLEEMFEETWECIDHVVVLGERHLRHVLLSYKYHYTDTRTILKPDGEKLLNQRASPTFGKTVSPIRVGVGPWQLVCY